MIARKRRRRSSSEIKFGMGLHGANVVHYIPSPDEIREVCRMIRERGYWDRRGEWHPPWGQYEICQRRGGKLGLG